MSTACRICGKVGNNHEYTISENRKNREEKIQYFLCNECGCLQIKKIPEDMSHFYYDTYYSYNSLKKVDRLKYFKELLMIKRDRQILNMESSFLGKIISIVKPRKMDRILILKEFPKNNILDVGCGDGKYIDYLCKMGFSNLTGCDPYLKADKEGEEYKLYAKDIFNMKDYYNAVLFNHSFEHLANPYEIMGYLNKILKDDGKVLIRIPVMGEAWKIYKENWVSIDAPRHYFIYSLESFKILCKNTGFDILQIEYDSGLGQIANSELCKKGVLIDENMDLRKWYSKKELRIFQKKADIWNATGIGDQAMFVIRKNKDKK